MDEDDNNRTPIGQRADDQAASEVKPEDISSRPVGYREVLERLRAASPRKQTQREIVRKHADAIFTMIHVDGASVEEVGDTLLAMGEPVLKAGFAVAVRAELGRIADIREGRVKATRPARPSRATFNQGNKGVVAEQPRSALADSQEVCTASSAGPQKPEPPDFDEDFITPHLRHR